METFSYDNNESIAFIKNMLIDITSVCTTIGYSRLNFNKRKHIKEQIDEIYHAINSHTDSETVYSLYCKLMKDIPKFVIDKITMTRNTKEEVKRISMEPSIFEQCNKRLRESGIENEYDKIFRKKFDGYLKEKYGASIAANIDKDEYESIYEKWLLNQKRLFGYYVDFLKAFKVAPNQCKVHPTELFKGDYDTLKHSYRKQLEVFSKYASTINTDVYTKGIHSFDDVSICNGFPCYCIDTDDGNIIHLPVKQNLFYTYYVHNPYSKKEKNIIMRMLQNDSIDITYGLYGYTKFGDIDSQIEELKRLKQELPEATFMDLVKNDGTEESFHMALLYKPKTKETD